jgi:hypothetical protein
MDSTVSGVLQTCGSDIAERKDIHRHRRRTRCVAPALDDSAPEVEIEASGPGLEAALLESELLAVVRDRIQALPPRLRQIAELHLAVRLREAGRLEKAAVQLREAAIRQPRRMELWLELGTTLQVLGRNEEAREPLEAAMRRARDEASRAGVGERMGGG